MEERLVQQQPVHNHSGNYFGGPTVYRAESFNGTLKQTWDLSLRARAGSCTARGP